MPSAPFIGGRVRAPDIKVFGALVPGAHFSLDKLYRSEL